MSKTELGCHILQDKGHFAEFAQFIRQHGHESEDADLIMKLKSVLWAVVSFSNENHRSLFSLLTSTLRGTLGLLKEDFLSLKKRKSFRLYSV